MENNFSSYSNIQKTRFLSKLSIIPRNSYEMLWFLTGHMGYNIFFSKEKVYSLMLHYDISELQLDAFLILAKYVHKSYKSLRDILRTIIIDSFSIFDKKMDEQLSIVKNPKFLGDLSERFVCSINNIKMTQQIFMDIMTKAIQCSIESEFERKIYDEEDFIFSQGKRHDKELTLFQEKFINYLKENLTQTEKFFSVIYEKFVIEFDKILPVVQPIINICSKRSVVTEEEQVLKEFISHYLNLLDDVDDNMKIFYKFMQNMRSDIDYEPYFLDNEDFEKMFCDCYGVNTENFALSYVESYPNSHNNEKSKTIYHGNKNLEHANEHLSSIGYYAINNTQKLWMHMIEDCFVEHGFASNTNEIARLVYHVMSTEKDTCGFTNKYDTITLYEHFVIISIANNIDYSYEYFMSLLSTYEKIPFEYPIEFLMRILSRCYDVNILFYSGKLMEFFIDNALLDEAKNLHIYQESMDTFYNIVPIGSGFCKLYDPSKISNANKYQPLSIDDNIFDVVNDITCIIEI
jgi:hypothetical protein